MVSGHCDAGRLGHRKPHMDSVCYDQSGQCSFLPLLVVVVMRIQEAALPVRGFSFHSTLVMTSNSTTTMRLAIPVVASHVVEAQTRERLMPIEVMSGARE